MSKKHYTAIALRFRLRLQAAKELAEVNVLEDLARDLCLVFADDNENFDRGRFLAACGVEQCAA